MAAFDALPVANDHKHANLDLDDEEGHCSSVASTACSPTLSPQENFGTLDAAMLDDGSGKDSQSTPDHSDWDVTERQRWADFVDDDETISSNADEGYPHSSWLETMEQDWSAEQTWVPEYGCQWIPVAMVPLPWAPSMDDGMMFSYGHTFAFNCEEASDQWKPLDAPIKTARKKGAEEKSEQASKRKPGKKRTAAAKRAPKASSPQSTEQKSKIPVEREPTTIMIRNIPKGCTRAMVQSMLESEGFCGQFDFLYLPYSFDDWAILGHAFVNFLEHDDAEHAVTSLNCRALFPDVEDKLCEVCWSKALQGLAPCIGRFRNSPVMHKSVEDKYKPLLFADGCRVDFPEATRQIQVVRRCVQSKA